MQQGEKMTALTELFKKFPGIGQRQAERFAWFIAKTNAGYIQQLTRSITELHQTSRQCPECFIRHEANEEICEICAQNDPETLIIVEKDADAHALMTAIHKKERTRYFILGSLIPIANSDAAKARVPQLTKTVQKNQPKEIIIALSVHPDADHTARHLADQIQKHTPNTAITMLGRGLSSGSELEYADPETIHNAFKKRDAM